MNTLVSIMQCSFEFESVKCEWYILRSLVEHTALSAVFVCLAAVAAASPQFRNQPRQTFQDERQVAILRDDRQDSGDGNFNYNFEAENGISVSGSGAPGSEGQSNMQGSYRFTLPDGTIAEVRYVADEFGFRAESPLIPTPHPLPAHAVEQIRVAEEQRRRGITF
ncbi:cuticle protein AM1199-like [Penaeus chinensis]|uniref:cuticle protein AM1199-like n=1 Tax=Penaeus chinensis TaxID=139456 RepID=UPI001FB6E33F|nr:cuticle protein AM1199-like [Penaeus chinensis]